MGKKIIQGTLEVTNGIELTKASGITIGGDGIGNELIYAPHTCAILAENEGDQTLIAVVDSDLGLHYLAEPIYDSDAATKGYVDSQIPTVNNGTLTIQRNGTNVATFTANQSGNSTANITVPTKVIDLSDNADYVKYNSVLMPTNPFGGKGIYINSIDNALFAADKKFYVTVTRHKKVVDGVTYPYADTAKAITDDDYFVDSPSLSTEYANALFDGSYEGGITCASDEYMKVRIMFGPNTSPSGTTSYQPGYPYGTFYLSYYYEKTPFERSHYRVYNKYAPHTPGWKKFNTSVFRSTGSTMMIEEIVDVANYQRTCIEFIVFGGFKGTSLTEIDWKLTRPDLASSGATVTKFGPQSVYSTFAWYDNHIKVATIEENGNVIFKNVYPINNEGNAYGTYGSIGNTTAQWENAFVKYIYEDGVLLSNKYAPKTHTHSYNDLLNTPTIPQAATTVENGNTGYVTSDLLAKQLYVNGGHNHDTVYQAKDDDLTAIAGLTGTSGLLKKTAANTWALDTNTYLTSIPTATDSTLGGVKIGSNISVSSGTISLTKTNVTNALGYTPPTADDVQTSDQQNVSHMELYNLRTSSLLVPGRRYRIIDYITTTAQANTSSVGIPFDIIVTADNESSLNELASVTHREGVDYFTNNNIEAWEIKYCLDNDTNRFAWASPGGKGVIYWMKDEFNNEAPYDFKNIIYEFKKGFKVYTSYGPSYYGHYELTNETIVINEITYYKSNRISYVGGPWTAPAEIWTTTTTFSSYMAVYSISSDTTVTSLSYTIFDVVSDSYSTYTFNYVFSNTKRDASLEGLIKFCYNNIIKEYYNSNNKLQLNWNIFRSTSTTFNCYSNTFGDNCYNNILGRNCYNNTFGNNCHGNTFGNNCDGNSLGNSCEDNKFDYDCSNNIVEKSCEGNKFGASCSTNTLRIDCRYNTFENSCYNNTLGKNCLSNVFGDYCSGNTFGDYCSWITFGTSSGTIRSCQYILVDSGCSYLYITSTDTDGSSLNILQNVHIHLGINGYSDANRKTITIPARDLAYEYNVVSRGTITVET